MRLLADEVNEIIGEIINEGVFKDCKFCGGEISHLGKCKKCGKSAYEQKKNEGFSITKAKLDKAIKDGRLEVEYEPTRSGLVGVRWTHNKKSQTLQIKEELNEEKIWTDTEKQGSGRAYWFKNKEDAGAFAKRKKEKGHVVTHDGSSWVWHSFSTKKHNLYTTNKSWGKDESLNEEKVKNEKIIRHLEDHGWKPKHADYEEILYKHKDHPGHTMIAPRFSNSLEHHRVDSEENVHSKYVSGYDAKKYLQKFHGEKK